MFTRPTYKNSLCYILVSTRLKHVWHILSFPYITIFTLYIGIDTIVSIIEQASASCTLFMVGFLIKTQIYRLQNKLDDLFRKRLAKYAPIPQFGCYNIKHMGLICIQHNFLGFINMSKQHNMAPNKQCICTIAGCCTKYCHTTFVAQYIFLKSILF